MPNGCFNPTLPKNMRNILTALLFFVPAMLAAQQVRQDTLSPDTPKWKKIRILNSDLTVTFESDSGNISHFSHNVQIEHEGALMECDSATSWPNGIFEAFGNTKVMRGTTVVTGDTMIFSEITGKAKVKGKIVRLTDGSSTLRSTEVDFDTGTETGYFEYGGTIVDSFRILEAKRGYYYSKTKEFEFIGQVQSDTKDYVLTSDSMKYNSDTKVYTFHANTHIWSKDGYLSCDRGWYDSDKQRMFFYLNSYLLTDRQEIFADSIYYESDSKKGRMYSNVQVVDTVKKTVALADFADFDMNDENVWMHRNPSIILYDDKDSVFLRADTIYSVTQTIKIPVSKNDSVVPASASDSSSVSRNKPAVLSPVAKSGVDPQRPVSRNKPAVLSPVAKSGVDPQRPVSRNKPDAVRPVAKNGADSRRPVSRNKPDTVRPVAKNGADSLRPVLRNKPDSLQAVSNDGADSLRPALQKRIPASKKTVDSLSRISVNDSIASASDAVPDKKTPSDAAFTVSISDSVFSLPPVAGDTAPVEYIDSAYKEMFAVGNVKLYRTDFQLKSDSMYFNTIDSIWKIYHDPILWDGKKMQITSDSMKFYIKDGDLKYADFNGSAMIVTPEGNPDSAVYFDQIKSKNMRAHLSERKLTMFEATGNAQTLFFSLANFIMNKAESASLKMSFESGRIREVAYYSEVIANNNPFHLVREDEIKLPGYRWEIEQRPASGDEVLNRSLRPSVRTVKESLPKPSFPITKRIDEIESKIEEYEK
jgi:lipopolysaccharide export system protein LptA